MQTAIKVIVIIAILGAIVFGLSRCQNVQMRLKDLQSDTSGLTRTVTLYAVDGSIIDSWTGNFMIDTTDGIASFNDNEGKRIIISGTYKIVEEKR